MRTLQDRKNVYLAWHGLLLFTAVLTPLIDTRAAELYWDGSHGQVWGNKNNWQFSNGSPVPSNQSIGDSRNFTFNAAGVTTNQSVHVYGPNTFNEARAIDSLTFSSPGSVTLNSDSNNTNGNRLNMSAGAGNIDLLVRNGAGRVNVNSEVRITRENDWIHRGTQELNLNGLLRINDGYSLNLDITQGSGGRATFRGGIQGGASTRITKNGAGMLTLSGDNRTTFAGGLQVNEGELRITSAESLGTGGVTIDGATFRVNSAISPISNDFRFENTGGVPNFFRTNGYDVTIAGSIGGAGQWEKNGVGTLTLLGANGNSGFLNVAGGRVAGTPASLNRNMTTELFTSVELQGSGSYAGSISGSGDILKSGNGTVTLAGSNSGLWTGISSGVLRFGTSNLNSNIQIDPGASAVTLDTYQVRRRLVGGGRVDGDLAIMGEGFVDGSLVIDGSVTNSGVYNTLLNERSSAVTGDYVQTSIGTMQTTVDPNQQNTLLVGGNVQLGGTLYLDASQVDTPLSSGERYYVLSSHGLDLAHVFDNVFVENYYGSSSITYTSAPGYGSVYWTPEVPMAFRSNPADANGNGVIDDEDIRGFARALFTPDGEFQFSDGRTLYGLQDYFDLADRQAGVVDFDDLAVLAELMTVQTGTLALSQAWIQDAVATEAKNLGVPEPSAVALVCAALMTGIVAKLGGKSLNWAKLGFLIRKGDQLCRPPFRVASQTGICQNFGKRTEGSTAVPYNVSRTHHFSGGGGERCRVSAKNVCIGDPVLRFAKKAGGSSSPPEARAGRLSFRIRQDGTPSGRNR